MSEDLAHIKLPAAVARAVRERAVACGLPPARTLVQLIEVGLATARCAHSARPGPASVDDDEAAE